MKAFVKRWVIIVLMIIIFIGILYNLASDVEGRRGFFSLIHKFSYQIHLKYRVEEKPYVDSYIVDVDISRSVKPEDVRVATITVHKGKKVYTKTFKWFVDRREGPVLPFVITPDAVADGKDNVGFVVSKLGDWYVKVSDIEDVASNYDWQAKTVLNFRRYRKYIGDLYHGDEKYVYADYYYDYATGILLKIKTFANDPIISDVMGTTPDKPLEPYTWLEMELIDSSYPLGEINIYLKIMMFLGILSPVIVILLVIVFVKDFIRVRRESSDS